LPATSEDFPRAKEVVASSAAALVSDWAYRTTPPELSTRFFQKSEKKCRALFQSLNTHDARPQIVGRLTVPRHDKYTFLEEEREEICDSVIKTPDLIRFLFDSTARNGQTEMKQ
ncbi:hypothetical protein, partial [Rhizobium sp. L1K21]|uniref:hypothetical protein n=1 Tax=Rhizobium sp. L1K21 TaxID=2954933 RepID=UPI002093CC04